MKKHLIPANSNSRTPSLSTIYNSEIVMLLPIKHTSITVYTKSVPINKIPKSCVNFVIRVLVIRRGSITPYKNSRGNNIDTFTYIIVLLFMFVVLMPPSA
ncbi:hypothetical protein H5410_052146 [Solanum commersonii]|uniref:Uncharacterized protein n=1 Tax=Solanum commersonii TaxID=4109 RepID=A0A9J5X1F1_SOLCO|nr:hypothetical protein H5410_052146 [Solanum commersonii]